MCVAIVFGVQSAGMLSAQVTDTGSVVIGEEQSLEENTNEESTSAIEGLESSESSVTSDSSQESEASESSASIDSSVSSDLSEESSSASSALSEESSSSESSVDVSAESSDTSSSEESSSSASSVSLEVTSLEEQIATLRPTNIFPSFDIEKHAEIANAEELNVRIHLTLADSAGKTVDTNHEVTDTENGYRITLIPSVSAFKPGQYRLIATLDGTRGVTRLLQRLFRLSGNGEEDTVLVDELFQWGTLALNTDRDSYSYGDTMTVGAAVMSKDGTPLCVPELSGSLGDQTIAVAEFCNEPEKTLQFTVPEIANPTLEIHADNALRARSAKQIISTVDGASPMVVQRSAATRTTPDTEETISITVTSSRTFYGTLTEKIPAGFDVIDTSGVARTDETDDGTTITWEGLWQGGNARTLTYTVRTPKTAPVFGLFGPVEIRGNLEDEEEIYTSSSSEENVSISSSESSSSDASSQESESSASVDASSLSSAESSDAQTLQEDSSVSSSETSAESSSEQTSQESSSSDAFEQSSSEAAIEEAPEEISFLQALARSLLAALTIDSDMRTISYTEGRQWQMLSVEGESSSWEQIRERTLLLERTAQVFDAQNSPTFTLVETDLPENMDGSMAMETSVAVTEILHAIVTENDMQEIVTQKIAEEEAAKTGSDSEEIAELIEENTEATNIIGESITPQLKEELIDVIAMSIEEETSVTDAIEQVLNEETASADMVIDTVSTQIADLDETAPIPTDDSQEANTGTEAVISVNLTAPDGTVIHNPAYHFEQGSVQLVIDPITNFRPGVYTVEVLITNPLTGEVTTMYQQFAWGVLALNADKDVYNIDEVAEIHIGVLDDHGEIVCSAELTLDVVMPSGEAQTFTTDDQSIETTGTCGIKEDGMIDPDFRLALPLTENGVYELRLTATTENGTRQLASSITVEDSNPYIIKRVGATRLWPFAPSPMDITITFNQPFEGTVVEYLPQDFVVAGLDPTAVIAHEDDGRVTIRWTGNWEAGDEKTFHYMYDAPDISPQFYLLGPLELRYDLAPAL